LYNINYNMDGEVLVGILCGVVALIVILWVPWSKKPTPTPTQTTTPHSTPTPDNSVDCRFYPTKQVNMNNFNINPSDHIDLFEKKDTLSISDNFDYGNVHDAPTLTCKKKGSSFMYAPSGPTKLNYKYDSISNDNPKLIPLDGTISMDGDTCKWDPNSNICDLPICNVNPPYSLEIDNSYITHGVKQFLNASEYKHFTEALSCNSGYKYGKCSGPTNSPCNDPNKQNNKIDCLGGCHINGIVDVTKLTKGDCEKASGKWIYDPQNHNCSYEILNHPMLDITPTGQGIYKMCNNPGDDVNFNDLIGGGCNNTCYSNPNPIEPTTISNIPLSWANQCGFTNENLTLNTDINPTISCGHSELLTGYVYFNICKDETGDCNNVTKTISHLFPSATPIPPPCKGGGDTFDVFNNCEPLTCGNIYDHQPNKGPGAEKNCPGGKKQKSPSPATNRAVDLPRPDQCNPNISPGQTPFKFNINSAADRCCEDTTCSNNTSCPRGYIKPQISTPIDGDPIADHCVNDENCIVSACCDLQTCGQYMENKQCNTGYSKNNSNLNNYILPTCCKGMINIKITLTNTSDIKNKADLFKNEKINNIYPSFILKYLLTGDQNSIYDSTKIQKITDKLSFINNKTTFIDRPVPIMDTMETLLNISASDQYNKLFGSGGIFNTPPVDINFYILSSQTFNANMQGIENFSIQETYNILNEKKQQINPVGTPNPVRTPNPNNSYISAIDVNITDCNKGGKSSQCAMLPNNILGSQYSQCCHIDTCDNKLNELQKNILSGKNSEPAPSDWSKCPTNTVYEGGAIYDGTAINYSSAKDSCFLPEKINARMPPFGASNPYIDDIF
jgi:hypothetical protein